LDLITDNMDLFESSLHQIHGHECAFEPPAK
jgi:hypothetical protein